MKPKATVSISRACDITGKSERTVYYWIKKKKIKAIPAIGHKQIRIITDSLYD